MPACEPVAVGTEVVLRAVWRACVVCRSPSAVPAGPGCKLGAAFLTAGIGLAGADLVIQRRQLLLEPGLILPRLLQHSCRAGVPVWTAEQAPRSAFLPDRASSLPNERLSGGQRTDSAAPPQERFGAVAGNNGYLSAVSVTSGQPKGPEPMPPELWA